MHVQRKQTFQEHFTMIVRKFDVEIFRMVRMNAILKFLAMSLLLWISKTEAQATTPVTPSTSATPNVAPLPSTPLAQSQDDQDAQAIVDSHMKKETIAGILPYRERNHCIAINRLITDKNGGKYFITDDYIYNPAPDDAHPPFKDLCFGLVKDKGIVLSGYLNIFFEHQDETWIIIILVLTENMDHLKATYDIYHEGNFQHMISKQRHPFRNMLKKWCEQNREPDEAGNLNHDNVVKDSQALTKEEHKCGWNKKRKQIETILMKKSIKYAKAVIEEYEKASGGKPMEDIINDEIEACWLNHDLANAYSSLARYVKDKYKYIAHKMRQYSDGGDRWALWIMVIAVLEPCEWTEVNKAFQKDYPGESLSALVLKENTQDKVMAEMMAAIVDPTFKPTTFTPKLASGSSAFPTTGTKSRPSTGPYKLASSPPPVTPTTVVPTPSTALPTTGSTTPALAASAPAPVIPPSSAITPALTFTPTVPTLPVSAPTEPDTDDI